MHVTVLSTLATSATVGAAATPHVVEPRVNRERCLRATSVATNVRRVPASEDDADDDDDEAAAELLDSMPDDERPLLADDDDAPAFLADSSDEAEFDRLPSSSTTRAWHDATEARITKSTAVVVAVQTRVVDMLARLGRRRTLCGARRLDDRLHDCTWAGACSAVSRQWMELLD